MAEERETFSQVLAAIDAAEDEPDRHLSIQIDRSLREAIRAAKSGGAAAGITIKVKVKAGPDRRVTFGAVVSAQLPRPAVAAVTLYADEKGDVHRSDPNQKRLPFAAPHPITKQES